MDISGEFLRPEFAFEREFGQFRNWWARDKRIVGNAFSLLIYLVSHDRNFRVTQKRAQSELGLGRDAFLVARRKLERTGFLTVTEHRYPAGTIGKNGRPIGGHRQVLFTLQDPEQPGDQLRDYPDEANAENPLRVSETRITPVDNSNGGPSDSGSQHPADASSALAENPAQVYPPLKEDQPQEDQISSSSRTPIQNVPTANIVAARKPDDEDDVSITFDEETATLLRELHPRLDLRTLLSRLSAEARIETATLDIQQAAADVIGASARPIGDPVAYLATAISREPGRWVQTEHLSLGLAPRTRRGRPPTSSECAAEGHRWIGQWHEFCAACGNERPGWRDERDQHVPDSDNDNLATTERCANVSH